MSDKWAIKAGDRASLRDWHMSWILEMLDEEVLK
jgi:hypothetical protein